MTSFLLALLFVTFIWFFATGAILWANRLPRAHHEGAVVAATPLLGAGVCGLIVSAGETGPSAALLAFGSAILVWGWHELAFLMGIVTGPNRSPLPPDVRGLARFRASAATVIHHEVALALTLAALLLISWGAPNPVGAATFAILFAMRLSTKLNIFLGVPSLSVEMIPPHLAYLVTHFRKAPGNPLFPVSMLAGIGLLLWLAQSAFTDFGAALLLALTALGILEHLFMMLPIRDCALWAWAMPRTDHPKGRETPHGL
ncbi:putative photosynthetic complex assembly protein PuhE [Thermaurantiacus sp.]